MRRRLLAAIIITMALSLIHPVASFGEDSNSSVEPCQHEWEFSYTYVEPTCQPGKEVWQCSKCYEKQERTVPAAYDHNWDGWEVTKSPTIYKTGTKTNYCLDCGRTSSLSIAKLKPFAKFSKKKYTLSKGKTMKLKPKFARGDKIKKWKSSKKKVATVNKNGKITAKKKGTAKITVIMKSGKKATCVIKVKKAKKAKKAKKTKATKSGTVYVTATGERYHCRKNCYGLRHARTTYKMSKKEAIAEGFTPCHVCY